MFLWYVYALIRINFINSNFYIFIKYSIARHVTYIHTSTIYHTYTCTYLHYIHICVGVCICISVCIYVFIYMCVYICICVCIYICMCVCVYIYIYIYIYMYFYVCMYIVYVCICVCLCVYTYICWVWFLNFFVHYAKMKITLSCHFEIYLWKLYDYILKYCRLNYIRRWPSPFPAQWLAASPVSGHISVYIHQLAWVMFHWVTAPFYFLSTSQMLAGATESVSVVILVYSAR